MYCIIKFYVTIRLQSLALSMLYAAMAAVTNWEKALGGGGGREQTVLIGGAPGEMVALVEAKVHGRRASSDVR